MSDLRVHAVVHGGDWITMDQMNCMGKYLSSLLHFASLGSLSFITFQFFGFRSAQIPSNRQRSMSSISVQWLEHVARTALEVFFYACEQNTVDGRNPKQPPGMVKTL